MSINPDTYGAFLTTSHDPALTQRRHRRDRLGALAVQLATVVVLAALLSIPVFLIASLAAWTPLPEGAWARLGTLFAGTVKAATFALLVAVPLGIGAALFSASFASPRFRGWFKPCLEILEAIPTVVLGLVAFATVAPWLKDSVATLLALVVAVPALLLAGGFAFGARTKRAARWLPLWLVPVLIAAIALLVAASASTRPLIAVTTPWNTLLIGLALGLAAVPLVFSIAEDALLLIPATHVQSALALGATRWQALASIVIPAARSGLIAAIVLGASRCLGETMIVLMASGNTPLADTSPLDGVRTLSAELVLGLPEAAPPGGAYRFLLLAALALFVLTFALNLLAAHARAQLHRRASRGALA
ncbi:MAG: ABC transporter permease subunit [Rhodanobacteraceae bacterium]